MAKIKIVSIAKKERDEYSILCDNFSKMSSKFGQIEDIEVFNNNIAKGQKESEMSAKNEYTKSLEKYLGKYNIALDPKGKKVDSFHFLEILKDKNEVNFFIGGAYGFGDDFLNKCNLSISLSPLTFGYKVAKVILFEQIYRGLSLLNNHPYHKN